MSNLYIVATPIGNLEDITLRALRILREADVILCEDTRVTKKLLQKYEIEGKNLLSYHSQSGLAKVEKIIALLEEGKNLALVSDAGTPGISDPGSLLVSRVREHFAIAGSDPAMAPKVKIEPIPGPSALTAALSAAGVPASEFVFLGFLPHKKGRNKLFDEVASSKRTVVFYESPHRIIRTLDALAEILSPERRVVVARELTKMHEQFVTGSASRILAYFTENPEKVRGEFVVIIAP
jgi:16S rRNA (cytidine1402-2'-O)-methyltransferase